MQQWNRVVGELRRGDEWSDPYHSLFPEAVAAIEELGGWRWLYLTWVEDPNLARIAFTTALRNVNSRRRSHGNR